MLSVNENSGLQKGQFNSSPTNAVAFVAASVCSFAFTSWDMQDMWIWAVPGELCFPKRIRLTVFHFASLQRALTFPVAIWLLLAISACIYFWETLPLVDALFASDHVADMLTVNPVSFFLMFSMILWINHCILFLFTFFFKLDLSLILIRFFYVVVSFFSLFWGVNFIVFLYFAVVLKLD